MHQHVRLGCFWLLMFPLCWAVAAQENLPRLSLQRTQEFGWTRVLGTADAAQVYTILQTTNLSPNLSDWSAIATLLDRPGNTNARTTLSFLDPASSVLTQRFYFLKTQPVSPTNDWKNQVYFPLDPFADTNVIPGNPRPIKFVVDLAEPHRVYYERAAEYPFHYDFATERLTRFQGMSRAEFDAISLRTNNQQILLGAVLLPPASPFAKQALGIQFVGLDAYPAEQVRDWFRLVQSTIMDVSPNVPVYYMPTLEQTTAADSARAYFASNGIEVGSADIWVQGGAQVYATGWALGRLKFFRSLDIRTAFNQGLLLSTDLLLTDGIPAEIPLVAGIITLVPSTPNSHVAILAKSYGIPFVYLADPAERTRVRSLENHEVILRARETSDGVDVKVVDVEGSMTPEFRAELLALKTPPVLNVVPMATYGAFSASTTNLTPADIRYFGGKAANFGVLRRTVPTNSPDAIAFSFDLWNAFMEQTLPSGQTLRATINQRLGGYTYPPDLTTLQTNLAAVRDLIRQTAQFNPAQRNAITNILLAHFVPGRNIRFRSSTNLEDTDNFVGAGLYDSYSGCLADDLDGDTTGPSICDPTETGERGVFRAIQRVYASFYNENAFIERLRFNVNPADVGMAVLVHYSFPDDIEMANGVATYEYATGRKTITMSTQVGAESVTNPDGTSLPEVVEVDVYSFGAYPRLVQNSTRTNGTVLAFDSEYVQLANMMTAIANAYRAQFTNKALFQLDFEYKKVVPGVLEIKQVREIPSPPSTMLPAPYLISHPAEFVVRQGECGGIFAVHYLKSKLHVDAQNTRLDRTNSTFLSNATFEFVDGTNLVTVAGAVSNWPALSHIVNTSGAHDTWSYSNRAVHRTFTLSFENARPTPVSSSDPIRFLSDFQARLGGTFSPGVPTVGATMTNGSVCLELLRVPTTNDPIYSVSVADQGKLAGGTFFTPYEAQFQIIKTIPLLKWIHGNMSGFTTNPVTVSNYFALSFVPGHHNFENDFIIDPVFEPTLSASRRAELGAQNIRFIYGNAAPNFGPGGSLYIIGFDGTVRAVQ